MVKVCVLSAFLVIYFLSAFGKELNNVTRKRYKDVRGTIREWLFYHYYPISFDDLNVFFFFFIFSAYFKSKQYFDIYETYLFILFNCD